MNKQLGKVWTFASDSNPDIEHETLQYVDGTASCNIKRRDPSFGRIQF
jgi:hypothetical protein